LSELKAQTKVISLINSLPKETIIELTSLKNFTAKE